MTLSTEKLQALDDLPAPASLDRIVRFLSDLGEQGNTPLGESGRSAQAFAASLSRGTEVSFSARQTSGWVAILMDRYQIKIGEIQEFALWFVQRQEILSEVGDLIEPAPASDPTRALPPDFALARLPAPALMAAEAENIAPDTLSADTPDNAPATQTWRKSQASSRNTLSSRRIGRKPAPLDTQDTAEPDSLEEDVPAPRRSFRLKPNMVTRPAFVTNVGLFGMLAGLSIAPASAAGQNMPAMALASAAASPTPGFGPAPGSLPTFGTSVAPNFAPTVAPSFAPTVTPMLPPAPVSPSPVWLGMPAQAGRAIGNPPAPQAADLYSPQPMPTDFQPAQALMPGSPPVPQFSPTLSSQALPLSGGSPAMDFVPSAPPAQLLTPDVGLASGSVPGTLPLPGGLSPALTGLSAGNAALSMADRVSAQQAMAPAGMAIPSAYLSPQLLSLGSAASQNAASQGQDAAAQNEADLPDPTPPNVTPEMGQMTLLAPPLQVASAQAERSGIAASMDWTTLAGGAGPLDEGGLAHLKKALPDQASLLYPALPVGSLTPGAVNLPLSAPLVQSLLQKGYGNATLGAATQAASLASSLGGGKPAAAPLSAQLVPAKSPAGTSSGVTGHAGETKGGAGALAEAGKAQATRGGVMDFLGMPVRLAPSLGGTTDLTRETTARNSVKGPGQPTQPLRPEQFAPLRNRLFPAFQSMTVEPDKAAWQKAAPALGLRDGKATTVLSPDARLPLQTLTSPQPPSRSRPSLSSPAAHAPGGPFAPLLTKAGQKPSVTASRSLHTTDPSLSGLKVIGAAKPDLLRHPRGAVSSPAGHAPGHYTSAPMHSAHISHLPAHGPSLAGILPSHQPLGLKSSGISRSVGQSGVPPHGRLAAIGQSHFPSLLHAAPHVTSAVPHLSSASVPHLASSVGHLPARLTHGSVPRGSLALSSIGHGISSGHSLNTSIHPALHSRRLPGAASSGPALGGGLHSVTHPLGTFSKVPGHLTSPRNSFAVPGGLLHTAPQHARKFPTVVSAPAFLNGQRQWNMGGHNGPSPVLAVPGQPGALKHFMPSRLVHSPVSPTSGISLSPHSAGLAPSSGHRSGPKLTGGFGRTTPSMSLAPRLTRHQPADSGTASTLAIQRASHSTQTTPAQNQPAPARTAAPSGPNGAAAGEANAMANEVWSLLKRRLATEAERHGRW